MMPAAPASPGQLRHWAYQRGHPDSAAFNMTVALRLGGVIEPSCARQALLWLLDRHQALRMTFAERNGSLTQHPQPAEAVSWEMTDLSGKAPQQRYAQLRELGAAEAGRPFDLEREPVTRLRLIRLGPAEHVLIMNVHHIAFDGWSLAVSLEELAAGYGAALAARPDPAAPLRVRYADFARSQQAAVDSAQWRSDLVYWRRQLADPPPPLSWPGAPAWPAGAPGPASHGETCWGLLPSWLPPAITRLAHQLRATPYMVQMAAYLVLLQAWTGRDELCVGVPFAARPAADYERVIGFFVNTVALRAHIHRGRPMAEIIGLVRQQLLDAHRHHRVPYGTVLQELAQVGSSRQGPLFQTMLILHNEMRTPPPWGDALVQQTILATGYAKYDLTVSMEGREGTVAIDAECRPACMSSDSVVDLLGSYAAVLQAVTADPGRRAAEIGDAALSSPTDLSPPAQPGRSATETLFRGPVADWRPGRDASIAAGVPARAGGY